MERAIGLGFNIFTRPSYDKMNFLYWKSRMEYLIQVDFESWIALKKSFKAPKDKERIIDKKKKCVVETIQKI